MVRSPVKLFSFFSRRPLVLEALECRNLLAGIHDAPDLVAHAADHSAERHGDDLTVSFAPDGTDVAGFSNVLHEVFASPETVGWQKAVLSAFEEWTQHIDMEVDVVDDSGAAFGSRGQQFGDPRFGDVRVAAVPLSADVIAMSVAHDDSRAGTWAGDILLNSTHNYESVDEVFRVVLHEVGHVLGLEHSDDPDSAMHKHGEAAGLSEEDIDLVNELHADHEHHSEPAVESSYRAAVDAVVGAHVDFSHDGSHSSIAESVDNSDSPTVLFSGTLVDGQVGHHRLEVTSSQLIHFSLEAFSPGVVAVLYDSSGRELLDLATGRDELLLLAPGEYSFEVTLKGVGNVEATYTLTSLGLAQYLGPELVDPSGSPITPCDEGAGEFCYPDGLASWESYIWVDGELEPEDDSDTGSNWYDDWWAWYIGILLAEN